MTAGPTAARPEDQPHSHHRRRWYSPRSILGSVLLRPRVYVALIAAVAVLAVLPSTYSLYVREAWAWIAGGIFYLALSLNTMWRCDGRMIVRTAARNDDSRMIILGVILVAIAASFSAIVGLLHEAKDAQQARWIYLALAGGTTAVSWAVTQIAFTMHYAHDYYRPSPHQENARRGLIFPDEPNPDYWDFLYFATSIGATSQTSDVSIRSRTFRRLVTLHAIVSFFFNVAVLALMINLASGLI